MPKYDSQTFQVQFTCKKWKQKCFNVCCRIEKDDRILWIQRFIKQYVEGQVMHEWNQQYLLSEGSRLTLEKALDIALSLESVISQTAVIRSGNMNSITEKTIVKVSNIKVKKCYQCDHNHVVKSCPFTDKECFYCPNKV